MPQIFLSLYILQRAQKFTLKLILTTYLPLLLKLFRKSFTWILLQIFALISSLDYFAT